MRWFALLLAAQLLPAQSDLAGKIDGLLESSPAARQAFWGIRVISLPAGQAVYQRQDDRLFTPASNTKLFTTALALERLGPEHRLRTRITAAREPDSSGHLRGDLRLEGGGDPTLSAREIPYRKGPATGDPLRAIEELADSVASRGIKRIDGDILGDDTAYVWAPYPEGWAQDDLVWEYGAPISALTLNDNTISLTVRPGARAGDPARLSLSPPIEYYSIDNRVRTVPSSKGKIEIERLPGGRQLRLWGEMGLKESGKTNLLAVGDPALFAAAALYDALTGRGVVIAGKAVAVHRFANTVADLKGGAPPEPRVEVELAVRISPPLVEILRVIDKVSQNLHAELALREVGRVRRNAGSRDAGLEEMRAFLNEAGIGPKEYELNDASGLSRLNLVSPVAVTKLLAFMSASKNRDAWLGLLPVGGEDGTLSSRFQGAPEASAIRAKTGTLSHVSALSGYTHGKSRGDLAFSILVNNYGAGPSEIRRIIDTISILISQ